MFDLSGNRYRRYSAVEKDAVRAELMELFKYVFSSIEIPSPTLKTVLSFMIRLLLTIPKANINTFRNMLEENVTSYERSRYRSYIDDFDRDREESSTRNYFMLQFFSDRVAPTKASLLQRLNSVISLTAFEQMFTTVNKLDLFDEMNKRSVILVNSNARILKESSTLFGRYILARCMAAAFEREPIPQGNREPFLIVIDEAAPYFDEMFEKLWTRVRQYKVVVLSAFQHMKQLSPELLSAIGSSTSVKLVGGLGFDDSRWIARDMNTSPEFLLAQKSDPAEPPAIPEWAQIACFVRKSLDRTLSVFLKFHILRDLPQMSAAEHQEFLKRNSDHVSDHSAAPLPESLTSLLPSDDAPEKSPPESDDDAATDWR